MAMNGSLNQHNSRSVILTGASGYIGTRLLGALAEDNTRVMAVVRDRHRISRDLLDRMGDRLEVLEIDFSKPVPVEMKERVRNAGPFDAAYFLLHSMAVSSEYAQLEYDCARHFVDWVEYGECSQLIYLGALKPEEEELSEHLASRERVKETLMASSVPLTVLRASIIVGSGSASFEIIRDLAEKLPFMITPRWVQVECQPIAIRNVITYLLECVGVDQCLGTEFDVGGPEVMKYGDLISRYAEIRGLKRLMIPVPFFSAKLSSHWLHFVTATNLSLAKSLVGSMRMKTVCREDSIRTILPQSLLGYDEAISRALSRIAQNKVPSTWYDSLVTGALSPQQLLNVHVPEHGVYRDSRKHSVKDVELCKRSVWSIGGRKGWPVMDWAWKLRGLCDKWVGGIGLRRGRKHPTMLYHGDALDFWRVLLADEEAGRLILYAEMKLPGEAWLEFKISDGELCQTATFRPKGLFGRFYWLLTAPVHALLFPRMVRVLSQGW